MHPEKHHSFQQANIQLTKAMTGFPTSENESRFSGVGE
jgi:hypothetical protein